MALRPRIGAGADDPGEGGSDRKGKWEREVGDGEKAAVAAAQVEVGEAEDGALRFDIVLQGPGQTTFFAV